MDDKFASLALPVEKASRMTILHPVTRQPLKNGDGREAYIEMLSIDSEVAQKHRTASQQRRLNMGIRAKLNAEELEQESIDLLAWLTVGWHLVGFDGEVIDVPFSKENARKLYGQHALAWLREQVDQYVADRGNFSGASSTS